MAALIGAAGKLVNAMSATAAPRKMKRKLDTYVTHVTGSDAMTPAVHGLGGPGLA